MIAIGGLALVLLAVVVAAEYQARRKDRQ